MNKTYNVVFNKSIGEYQVTSELVTSRKKTKSSKRILTTALASLFLTFASAEPLVVDKNVGFMDKNNNNLSDVIFNIKDDHIPDSSMLYNAIETHLKMGGATHNNLLHQSFREYDENLYNDAAIADKGQLISLIEATVSETIESTSDHNVVIKGWRGAGIRDSAVTLFNNKSTLILGGLQPSYEDPGNTGLEPFTIRNNNVVGDLITNSGEAYLGHVVFRENSGNITNSGTMTFHVNQIEDYYVIPANFVDGVGDFYNSGMMVFNNIRFSNYHGALQNSGTMVLHNTKIENRKDGITTTLRNNDGDLLITGDRVVDYGGRLDYRSKFDNVFLELNGGNTIIAGVRISNGEQEDGISKRLLSLEGDADLTIKNSRISNSFKGGDGGAIAINGGKSLQILDTIFSYSSTTENGGAIVIIEDSGETDFILKNNSFLDNSAGLDGGAIYTYRDFELIVDQDKTAEFSGNRRSFDYESGKGIANSIASANRNNLHLAIDGILYMDDPLYNLGTVTKTGTGMWLLGGNNNEIDTIHVKEGGLNLLFDDYDNSDPVELKLSKDFILGSTEGKSTLILSGNNNITAPNIYLNESRVDSNTTLEFETSESLSSSDYLLTLSGKITSNNVVNINIENPLNFTDPSYKLLRVEGDSQLSLDQYKLIIHGKDLRGTRYGEAYSLGYGDSEQKTLDLKTSAVTNVVNRWTGQSENDATLWNHAHEKNWSHATGEFLDGDIALFVQDGIGDVEVRVIDGSVAGAIIVGGDKNYLFKGSIGTSNGAVFSKVDEDYNDVLGRFVVGAAHNYYDNRYLTPKFSGVVDLTGTNNNHFANGIEIESGTLKISSLDQIQSSKYKNKEGGNNYPFYNNNPNMIAFTGAGTLLIANDADMLIDGDNYEFVIPGSWELDLNRFARIKGLGSGQLTFSDVYFNGDFQDGNLNLYGSSLIIEGSEGNPIIINNSKILLKGNSLELSHIYFKDSILQEHSLFIGGGSGYSNNMIIKNSIFDNIIKPVSLSPQIEIINSHFNKGKTLYYHPSQIEGHYLNIVDSSFVDSDDYSALYLSGAQLYNDTTDIVVDNSEFTGNKTGITIDSANVKIDNSRFESNKKGINVESSDIAITNTQFIGNEESSAISVLESTVNINNALFTKNEAHKIEFNPDSGLGGAISTYINYYEPSSQYSTLNIMESNFKDNLAVEGGGAIFGVFETLNLTDTSFENNIAIKGKGGAINFAGTLNLIAVDSNVTFSGNKADGVSSAIYAQDNAVLNIDVADKRSVDMQDALVGGQKSL